MSYGKAKAGINIALIKYWGKRDERLFLPMNSSLSMTLDNMYTVTEVQTDVSLDKDLFFLNDRIIDGAMYGKTTLFMDKIRTLAGSENKCRITSFNHVPTAAGFASSASGFAALAGAASKAYGLDLTEKELSILARQGSGSASRSVYGGFAVWHRGASQDGQDSYAEQILAPGIWPISVIGVTVDDGEKALTSREAMARTVATSPMYEGWLGSVDQDMDGMLRAITLRDFEHMGQLTEHNCLKMHATMLTSIPSVQYWNGATMSVMSAVRELRQKGFQAYFTIDAGPNVKVLCQTSETDVIMRVLKQLQGVRDLNLCHQGNGITYL